MRNLKTTRQIKGFECKNPELVSSYKKQGKPIVAVDFDGCLVHNKYPYCENPNMELIDFIREHKDDYVWILWTCRANEQLNMAKKYLYEEFGLIFDLVNENVPWMVDKYGDTRKVYADYYIDDRNANVGDKGVVLIV